jgi:DNA-binding IclR family transcriptional regulator
MSLKPKSPTTKTRPKTDVPESSLERMIGLLDLFQGVDHCWTVEQMHKRLGYTRSTLYRYLKVLSDAELLTSLPDAGYTPGPRIVELDYDIRKHDPLIVASIPVMVELVSDIPSTALLCRRYRDKVLCIHRVAHPSVSIESTYERGRARPLFSGAASRIILANISPQHLKRLYEQQPKDFATGHLGKTFEEISKALKDIRQRGWDQTTGQVTPGITGVAAPIFDTNKNVLGSLSLSIADKNVGIQRLSSIADRVMLCARIVSQAMYGQRGRDAPS